MTDRTTYIYEAARTGNLDYAEVRTSQDAVWAYNGYTERRDDESLPLDERRFAADFIRNLDADFG